MNKIIVVASTLIAIGLIGSVALGGSTSAASVIEVDKTLHDFGEIDIFAGKVEAEFTLTNIGTEDVQITAAETSCMCTEGKIGDFTFGMHGSSGKKVRIPAGESKTLTAIYDPLAHGPDGVGLIKRELFINTNSTKTPQIKVQIAANVVKSADVE